MLETKIIHHLVIKKKIFKSVETKGIYIYMTTSSHFTQSGKMLTQVDCDVLGMSIIISKINAETLTIQSDILKNTTNTSRRNIKNCSSRSQEVKKREIIWDRKREQKKKQI